jgi:hypothetical protein
MDGCASCGAPAAFSVEDDTGAEHLACQADIGRLLTRLFDQGLIVAPAWGATVYDVRPS